MFFLNDFPDDLVIAELHEAIGNLVIRFPLLHCEECANTLKQWLKQRGIHGKLWR
ncbi:MAG: papain fold toxin domain-containing protein, partial [Nostoc sp.]